MKAKIFNTGLITFIALSVISLAVLAQDVTSEPQAAETAKPAPKSTIVITPKIAIQFDKKEMQHSIDRLNSEMKKIQKMSKVVILKNEKKLELVMKDFDKNFDANFDENFNFTMPSVALGFKDSGNNFNYDYNYQDNHNGQNSDNNELVKNYSKSYPADANDQLQIKNLYGKVTVNTWNKNEFKVDVQIKVSSNSAERSQQMLDNVTINDGKNGSTVFFETNIAKSGSPWKWLSEKNSYHKLEINYTVYMPSKNSLAVTNRYGPISLPDLQGKVIVNSSYGSLVARSLSNNDNTINVSYGSANIENLNISDLDVKYGSLILGSVDNLNATVSYSSAKIGRIITSGNINIKYVGGFQIDDVDKKFKNLSVNSSYSSVKLGIDNNENADFDVTVNYGSFSYGNHEVNMMKKSPGEGEKKWSPTQNYKGHLGKGNTDKVINIISKYGDVKFD